MIVFSVVAMSMTIYGQTAGVAVFVDPVSVDLGLTRSETSTVYSLGTLVAVVGTALGPVLVAVINDATGSFEAVAPLLVWIPLAIAGAALVVRPPERRRDTVGSSQVHGR